MNKLTTFGIIIGYIFLGILVVRFVAYFANKERGLSNWNPDGSRGAITVLWPFCLILFLFVLAWHYLVKRFEKLPESLRKLYNKIYGIKED